MIIAKAGLDNGLMYSIPKNNNKHISFSFIVNILLSIVIVVLLYVFIQDIYIRWMLPLIWLVSAERLFFGIYRSQGKIKEYYFINGFLSMIIRIGSIVGLYYVTGENEYSVALGVYISFIFSNVVYYIKNKKNFGEVNVDKEYLKYSIPLVFATMMSTIINRIDIIMIGNMTNESYVGIYEITFLVSNSVASLLIIFNTVFAPKIANLYHSGQIEVLQKLYVVSTRGLAIVALIITVIIIMNSEFILSVFGEDIVEGVTALNFRSIGQFINIAVGGVWLMLSMTGKTKFQLYANIFVCIVNISLNFILIPIYGINGAAFASMVSIVLINITGYFIVSRLFKVKVFKYI
ncbi:O-antigen/teichoic acid export membrane protein [Salibacterium salarium]|nr:O-antigen/teichoic acid export membrane protein [Salibacterium salarium]